MTDALRASQGPEGTQVVQDVSLGWTVAQKSDWRNFRAGQVLGFHRAVKGIERNASVEVVRADARGVVVRAANGEERTVTRKQARCFEVFNRQTMEVAPGDRLLLTANRRQPDFRATNGEIVTVDRLDERGRIVLQDGRVVPRDYTYLAPGFAITAHRSQGKSVDEVIVAADGMAKELFYVAASRGRERVTVITSDAESLRQSVGRSMARRSATELARAAFIRMDRCAPRGIARRPDAAKEVVLEQEVHLRRTHEHGIGR